jgi:AraC family transcriptional regulator, regulatory protein of adaptative response / methylated-DNA-[protein]-cysteine methyltransferase
MDALAKAVAEACRYLEEHAATSVKLSELAARAGFSPFHFQRAFKATTGVTPKVYQSNARVRLLKAELRKPSSVTAAMYSAGFGSSSRLYEKLDEHLAMTPLTYKSGGKGLEISYATTLTFAGLLMMAATDRGVCFVQFGESQCELEDLLASEFPAANRSPMPTPITGDFAAWMDGLHAHLSGTKSSQALPLAVQGTAFQIKVWRYLQTITRGSKQSYSDVAMGINQPTAVRAVASACARNRIGILIPCHRVIRGNGELVNTAGVRSGSGGYF